MDRNWCREEVGTLWPSTGKENGGGGKTEDFDAMEVKEEMVQKSMVHGMESCRDTKENED